MKILYRISKITPKKLGQFVTLYKREKDGTIVPYDQDDDIGCVVVKFTRQNKIGEFVFPKSVLVEHNIFSKNGKGGKRGMRVYSPWDVVANKQAKFTQAWQIKYCSIIQ